MSDDTGLLDYCQTDTQRRTVEAVIASVGNRANAATALGVHERSVYQILARVKAHAARQGFAPDHSMTHTAAPGFAVKGVSTLYDADGEQRAQWVKTTADQQRQEDLREAIVDAFTDWKGKGRVAAAPKHADEDLLTVYPMGDPHLGLYAWGEETGDDFDLKIGEATLCDAVKRLIACSPDSKTGLILNLGDFFHSDSQDNRTSRSGHPLDVDTRWAKVLRVGVRTLMSCVEAAARKHEKVIVKCLSGNHDDQTSQMLSIALALFYEGNERVIVDESPSKFWFHRFGSVLLGATHGDTCKPPALPGIMAHDRAEDWGATQHRYWYTGHIHNQNVMEFPGVIWESFRTLAGKDAWTASKGYRSGRDMYAIVHAKDYGEVERHRVDISMLKNGNPSS